MLNIYDVIRNVIAVEEITEPHFFCIENLTGYHQCLLHSSKLHKILPQLVNNLRMLSCQDTAKHLTLLKINNSLQLKFGDEIVYHFTDECEFIYPYTVEPRLRECAAETSDSLIEKIRLYCNFQTQQEHWSLEWVNESLNNSHAVGIINLNQMPTKLSSTEFYLFYPFLSSEVQAVVESMCKPQLKAFLADDSETSLFTTKAMLENLRVNVTVAADGADAVSICKKQEFDLIILDEKMPHLFGSDVFQELKKLDINNGSIKVILSGITEKDGVLDLAAKGIDIHLEKPVTKLKLQNLINQIEESNQYI